MRQLTSWHHSERVRESNYVLLYIVVKFVKMIIFFANNDFIFGISTNKSLPRWGKVAQRLAKFIVLLYFGVVTDEVVSQSVILFSAMQVYTALSVLCCRDGGRDMPAFPHVW